MNSGGVDTIILSSDGCQIATFDRRMSSPIYLAAFNVFSSAADCAVRGNAGGAGALYKTRGAYSLEQKGHFLLRVLSSQALQTRQASAAQVEQLCRSKRGFSLVPVSMQILQIISAGASADRAIFDGLSSSSRSQSRLSSSAVTFSRGSDIGKAEDEGRIGVACLNFCGFVDYS